MSKARKTFCPVHETKMVRSQTRYGPRYDCHEAGCTVMCWGGETSTPADKFTRIARCATHDVFNLLWKGIHAVMSKGAAYKWLAEIMDKQPKYAHIGMANREECLRIIDAAHRRRREPVQ